MMRRAKPKAKQNAVRVGREEQQQYADELGRMWQRSRRRVLKTLSRWMWSWARPVSSSTALSSKAVISGKNDKLTMNTYAQIPQGGLGEAKQGVFHTVVRDVRDGRDVYFYRRGIAGSARLGFEAKSISEVKAHDAQEKGPAAARRTDNISPADAGSFFEDAEGKGCRDLKNRSRSPRQKITRHHPHEPIHSTKRTRPAFLASNAGWTQFIAWFDAAPKSRRRNARRSLP